MDRDSGILSGTVDSLIYRNEENGYTVLRLRTGDRGLVTAVGVIPAAMPGERLDMTGTWTSHPYHGEQFKADTAVSSMPVDTEDVFAYLSSGAVKGIGPATARELIERFGAEVLDVLENSPERIAEIRGIGMRKAREMVKSYRSRTSLRRLMEFFAENGIRLRYALRLYRLYGDDARAALLDNPYVLTDEYVGAEFAEADAFALALGFDGDAPERVQAAVLYELSFNADNGHSFIPRERLAAAVTQLIGVQPEAAEAAIGELESAGSVVFDEIAGRNAVYLASLHRAETYVAARLRAMSGPARGRRGVDADRLISECESEMGITLAQGQRNAVKAAAVCGVMALTGGPGTGKTTTVRAVLRLFEKLGLTTALAAPTGRAAKRMSELAGTEASTIHRLLEAGYDEFTQTPVFRHGESDPLAADAVILDEASMIDVTLMESLLRALKPDCRLVMVGDANQLPSVGPGNVFSDVLRSGAVETVRLTEVFRQAGESAIVRNAHLINAGEMPPLGENRGDFFFLSRRDAERAADTVIELASSRLPGKMGIPPQQIQVLSPTRRYVTGTVSLNARLQQALNPAAPGKAEKEFGEITFRTGDRVMQIRNNYDIIWRKPSGESGMGVFNGDVGHIVEISHGEQMMTVDFDERLVTYTFDMLGDLELAYAMTVHKAQGSEYRAVILSLGRCAPALLSRAVLYTAVTRARELLIIVGESETVAGMIGNDRPQKRYSGLKTRLSV
ncbi:MAG: ATP-dependent RecD-like DNA helicase [Oscillospiraceae bacterium]|nr:ATP-dependent RecD-like DNA helicase [Oscillospiraceae bacterium]